MGFQLLSSKSGEQTLVGLSEGPQGQSMVRQIVESGGKVLRIEVGPFPVYSPRADDELVLRWTPSMFQYLTASFRRQGNGSTMLNLNNSEPQDVVINVAATQVTTSPTITTVSGGGTVIVGGGSFGGGPSLAGAANRQALLNNAARCPTVFGAEKLSPTEHPLGFGIGSTQFTYHLGVLAGNSTIAVALLLLHFLIGIVVKLIMKCSWLTAMEHVRFPARSLPVLSYLMQPTMTSALIIAQYSPHIEHTIACVTVLLVSLAIIAGTGWILVSWKPPRFDVYYWYKPHDPNRSWHSRLTYCTGYYLPRSMARMSFVKMMGPIFEDYNPDVRYFFFIDLLTMVVSSYILAVFPESVADCEYTFLATLAVFFVYVVICFITRPFTAVIVNISFLATAATQFLAVLFLYIAFKTNSQLCATLSDVCNIGSIAMLLLTLAYSVVKGVVELWQGDDQNRKVSKQAQRLFDIKAERSEVAVHKAMLSVYRDQVATPALRTAMVSPMGSPQNAELIADSPIAGEPHS